MPREDELYGEATAAYGAALERLARACEANAEERRDLLQEMHLALWRSFRIFDGRCSMRTWVYRVAHNAAASHAMRARRGRPGPMLSLEDVEGGIADTGGAPMERGRLLEQLYAMVQRLKPVDRQVIVLYLEGMDAAGIGEVTGISAGYAATKIHRIKRILSEMASGGGTHEQSQ
jgi:RNA polymerase sigma-70 factor (ECF subfamily)